MRTEYPHVVTYRVDGRWAVTQIAGPPDALLASPGVPNASHVVWVGFDAARVHRQVAQFDAHQHFFSGDSAGEHQLTRLRATLATALADLSERTRTAAANASAGTPQLEDGPPWYVPHAFRAGGRVITAVE